MRVSTYSRHFNAEHVSINADEPVSTSLLRCLTKFHSQSVDGLLTFCMSHTRRPQRRYCNATSAAAARGQVAHTLQSDTLCVPKPSGESHRVTACASTG